MSKASAILIVDEKQKHATEVATLGAKIIAARAGIALTLMNSSSPSTRQIDDILADNPGHTLPALILPAEKFSIRGTQAVFRTLARMSPEQSLLGFSFHEQALCDEWMTAAFELEAAIVPFLFAYRNSKESEVTKRGRSVVNSHLHVINDRLLHTTFLATTSQPTVADIALYVVLFNSLAKSEGVSEVILSASRDLVHLGRWMEHATHSPVFTTTAQASASTPPNAFASVAAPCPPSTHTVPKRKEEKGVVWLSSGHVRDSSDVQPTTPLFNVPDLPAFKPDGAHHDVSGVVRLGSSVYAPSFPKQTQKAAVSSESSSRGFIHDPFPSSHSFVVEAPAPNEKEEYGRPEYVRLGQDQLRLQWASHANANKK
eukprot:c5428_g1_i1.p1 GENE.c5428_g1_i1~~c5428_g1_i1.p1  ORF type:complete len:393 (+),score=129.43 c5428_g1_i1:69-1181(+)